MCACARVCVYVRVHRILSLHMMLSLSGYADASDVASVSFFRCICIRLCLCLSLSVFVCLGVCISFSHTYFISPSIYLTHRNDDTQTYIMQYKTSIKSTMFENDKQNVYKYEIIMCTLP